MKGSLTLSILERLADAPRVAADLLDCFLTDYHSSYRMLRGLPTHRLTKAQWRTEREQTERQAFYNLISKLHRDGLVERMGTQNSSALWKLLPSGLKRLAGLKRRQKTALPSSVYETSPTPQWTIVTFDIPEREKRKRVWLRHALKGLQFTQLQKSVWIGKSKIPRDFLEDLQRLRMLSYIEMLAITKTGSLKQIN